MDKKKVVIIGNGVSGVTAARHIRKMSDHEILLISDETDHFWARTALMYIYMGHMKYEHTKPYGDWFWEKNRIDLQRGWVNRIDTKNKLLWLADEKKVHYDDLILAVGSSYNKFGWPGQDLAGVQGMYSYQDLELMEKNTRGIDRAVIVGGGLIGVEMAEMLNTRNIPVTFLVRENSYWAKVLPKPEGDMIAEHIKDHGVDLRLSTEMEEALPDDLGRVRAVKTKEGEEIPCQFLGLTAGVHPKTGVVKDSPIEVDKGILVNNCFETNIPNVYAVGDCAQFRNPPGRRPPIEQVWYTGKFHGEIVAHTICGERKEYQPGNWFNSAKFLDIEYQTYGWVLPELRENEATFYWEHESGEKAFRVVWEKHSEAVVGFNVFGIRFRHAICDKWIQEGKPIDEVMQELPKANFDPEFYKQHETSIIDHYNHENGKNLKVKAKKGLFSALFG